MIAGPSDILGLCKLATESRASFRHIAKVDRIWKDPLQDETFGPLVEFQVHGDRIRFDLPLTAFDLRSGRQGVANESGLAGELNVSISQREPFFDVDVVPDLLLIQDVDYDVDGGAIHG